MSLYKLPKDVLIKLITTIQEETEKRILGDRDKLVKHLINKYNVPININECERCDKFEIDQFEDKLYICNFCSLFFCNVHCNVVDKIVICFECSNKI